MSSFFLGGSGPLPSIILYVRALLRFTRENLSAKAYQIILPNIEIVHVHTKKLIAEVMGKGVVELFHLIVINFRNRRKETKA